MAKEPFRESIRPMPVVEDQSKAAQTSETMSVIGRNIVVKGDIEADVDIQIEGRVIGDVRCATLILGPDSEITGRIHADRVRVSGVVEGSIDTQDLAIEAGARVKGEVSYARIRIANGGVISGTFDHKPGAEEPGAGDMKLKLVEAAPAAPAKEHFFE